MKWIKASERLPLHKAHWNTNKYGYHDNDFPVRMNGRYSVANIFDEAKADDSAPIYMLKFESAEHYENQFSEIEWLDERESDPLYTEKDMINFCEWPYNWGFEKLAGTDLWSTYQWISKDALDNKKHTTKELFDSYLKKRIPSFK